MTDGHILLVITSLINNNFQITLFMVICFFMEMAKELIFVSLIENSDLYSVYWFYPICFFTYILNDFLLLNSCI